MPTVTGHRIEEVEVQEPRDGQQIILEVLGIAAAAPPEPRLNRKLRVTLEGGGFDIQNNAINVSIGNQTLTGVTLNADGSGLSGYVETMPETGSEIAFLDETTDEGRVVLAQFDPSGSDSAIA